MRPVRSDFRDRTAAMMMLVGLAQSWRTNSRPMPRLAPVRKYVGIVVVFCIKRWFDCQGDFVSWL